LIVSRRSRDGAIEAALVFAHPAELAGHVAELARPRETSPSTINASMPRRRNPGLMPNISTRRESIFRVAQRNFQQTNGKAEARHVPPPARSALVHVGTVMQKATGSPFDSAMKHISGRMVTKRLQTDSPPDRTRRR